MIAHAFPMKKSKIIEVVLEHLRADFERRQSAARRTREQGNDAESKSEGKYDTRSTEENYLADGLARQALEATAAAEAIEQTIRAATASSTRITITHRLRGICPGDHVIVLRDGRIEAEGSCLELASGVGWFADQLRTELDELEMFEFIEGLPVGVAVIRVPTTGGSIIGG